MSQNDYHFNHESGDLQPGLGKDEPTEEQKAGVRTASREIIQRMREEFKAQEAGLNERERAMVAAEAAQVARERAQEAKEREFEARERALVAAEKAHAEKAAAQATTKK